MNQNKEVKLATDDFFLSFFKPFKTERKYYKHKVTKQIKEIKAGFAYPCLFFGYLWFLFKGMWMWFFVIWFVAYLIYLLGEPLYYIQWLFFGFLAFKCRKWHEEHLIKKGYKLYKVIK